MTGSILWYATRGAGIVSLLLFTGVVALGVLTSLRAATPWWPRFLTAGFHRNLALLSVVFLAGHILTAVVDPYTALGPLAALVPFSVGYRRLWLGLGAVALDLLLAIVLGDRAPAWLEGLGLPARLVDRHGGILRVAGWPLPATGPARCGTPAPGTATRTRS